MSRLLATTGLLMTLMMAPAAFAADQATDTAVSGNVEEQQQIEQGLKSGELSTGEAARLEKGEAKIDKSEARALKDGTMSPQEAARIQNQQNKVETATEKLENNKIVGNPNSVSSKRMQADVQRNINQEKRIEQGAESGKLTNKEVGKLERGQAHVDRSEFRAGRNGHINAAEQARIQRKENRQSGHVWHKKHNEKVTGEAKQQ